MKLTKKQAVAQQKVQSIHTCVDSVVFEMFDNSDTILLFWGDGSKDREKANIPFNRDALWTFGKAYLKELP